MSDADEQQGSSPDPVDGPDGDLARVRVERDGGAARASLEGELDMSDADAVSARLEASAVGARELTVDLASLAFIDSAGIAALDQLARSLDGTGTEVRVIAPAGGQTSAYRGSSSQTRLPST